MGFFKLLGEIVDTLGSNTSYNPLGSVIKDDSPRPIYIPGITKPKNDDTIMNTITHIYKGNVEEAICEVLGINKVIRTMDDVIEAFNNVENMYYKKNNYYIDWKKLRIGSIVFCELAKKLEHSGIYVGNGEIIELNGDGRIIKVDFATFCSSSVYRTGQTIYTFTDFDGNSLGENRIWERAKEKLHTKVDYNIISENCHEFSYGCLTGNFKNLTITFTQLLEAVKNRYKKVQIRKIDF